MEEFTIVNPEHTDVAREVILTAAGFFFFNIVDAVWRRKYFDLDGDGYGWSEMKAYLKFNNLAIAAGVIAAVIGYMCCYELWTVVNSFLLEWDFTKAFWPDMPHGDYSYAIMGGLGVLIQWAIQPKYDKK